MATLSDGWRLADARATREEIVEVALEAVGDAIFLCDAEGRVVEMNGAGRRLLASEQHVASAAQPLPSASAPAVPRVPTHWLATSLGLRDTNGRPFAGATSPVRRVLRGERLIGNAIVDATLHGPAGGTADVEVGGVPVRDDDQVLGAVLVIRDVTDRRRLETRVREALDALLETTEALVESGVQDEQDVGRTLAVTPKLARRLADLACKLLDCQQGVIVTVEPETELVHVVAAVGSTPAVTRHIREAYEGIPISEAFINRVVERQTRAGVVRVLNLRLPVHRSKRPLMLSDVALVVPMRTNERLIGAIVLSRAPGPGSGRYTMHDLALARAVGRLAGLLLERDRLLRDRERARAESLATEEVERRMREFLSVVAHEVRTPITAIKLHLQLMQRRARRAEAQSRDEASREPWARLAGELADTDRQADRVTRLVHTLLDAERTRAGTLELYPARVDLAALARTTVEDCRVFHPGRSISLREDEDGPLWTLADAERVALVITHLVANAAKYSAEEQPIAVHVRRDGTSARVEVRDRGAGIPAEELQGLWRPLHRVPGVEVQSGSSVGFGVGLHLCKALIEQHDGHVGVESEVGQGSTFWFTLPLWEGEPDRWAPRPSRLGKSDGPSSQRTDEQNAGAADTARERAIRDPIAAPVMVQPDDQRVTLASWFAPSSESVPPP